MTERYVFADVNLPFHVWMKEGDRWVLRERADAAAGDAISGPGEGRRSAGTSSHSPAHR